jgi:hypothetical protein
MSTAIPDFSHASVERLCDYELPSPPARAMPSAALFPDPTDAENFALTWWLWMDGMSKNMLQHYDAWREQHFGPPAKKRP